MNIIINPLSSNEVEPVLKLIKDSFDTQVSSYYSSEGVQEFYKFIDIKSFSGRQAIDHNTFVAYLDASNVGVIEIRNNNHISMLFIDNEHRGQGIGSILINYIVDIMRTQGVTTITVNSSPNSVGFYRSKGFSCVNEKTINGIRFTEMKLEII